MPKILQIPAALAAVEKKKTGRKTHLKETTSVGVSHDWITRHVYGTGIELLIHGRQEGVFELLSADDLLF